MRSAMDGEGDIVDVDADQKRFMIEVSVFAWVFLVVRDL